MTTKTKLTRLGAGNYDCQVRGDRYEIEQYPDGAWLLFSASRGVGAREFLNDFSTLRAAKLAAELTTASQVAA